MSMVWEGLHQNKPKVFYSLISKITMGIGGVNLVGQGSNQKYILTLLQIGLRILLNSNNQIVFETTLVAGEWVCTRPPTV